MGNMLGGASRWIARAAAMAATLALVACGGGGGGGDTGEGTLRLSITDAPACYQEVNVTIEGVRVHTSATASEGDAGWRELKLAAPKKIDLTNLTNGVLEEIGSMPLPAGNYSQLRLVLADNKPSQAPANSVKTLEGDTFALKTPSGQQSGLKLQVHFTVEANKLIDLILDFDACKSVVQRGKSDSYLLKPVINVTPKYVAAIQGFVTTTLSLGSTVSAQQDGEVIRSTSPDESGRFVLAFLPSGTYTVVITADGKATGVVNSVPVTTGTLTTINGTSTAIVLPSSPMTTVTGHVTASTTANGTTTVAPVDDALVQAMQNVSGTLVQVNSTQVDTDGLYTMQLPTAAPRSASYSSTGTLTFTADSGAAGKYTLWVTAEGRSKLTRSITLGTSTFTANFGY